MKFLLYIAIITSTWGASLISFDFASFQMTPFRAVVILLTICLVALSLGKRKSVSLPIRGEQAYPTLFFLAWLFYSILSVIWAKDFSGWLKSTYFIAIGFLAVFLLRNVIENRKDMRNAFLCFQAGIAIQAVIGWYEVITRNYLFKHLNAVNYNIFVLGNQRMPIAMQNNPNDFATLMFVGICIAYICHEMSEKKSGKFLHIFLLANYAVLLFMTTSRANIIGLALSVMFFHAIKGKKGVAGVIALSALALAIPQVSQYISKLFHFSFTASSGSDAVRWGLIKNGFHFLLSTLGFGVGSGQIEYWMGNYAIYYHGSIINIHNWWMEILTAYGVGIFIAYIAFYWKLFKSFFVRFKTAKAASGKNASLAVCSLMVGFVVSSVSSSSNISCEWLWVFWALCIAYLGLNSMTSLPVSNADHLNIRNLVRQE